MSIDVGVIYDGWHGDGARSFICGGEPPDARGRQPRAVDPLALMAGIAAARPGCHLGDISAAVEDVALQGGYGIIRQYVGHGIGTSMHEDPNVPNFRTRSPGIELAPGHCFAIEPMFTLGTEDDGRPRRQLDRRDGGRLARRPLRAHDRRNGPMAPRS